MISDRKAAEIDEAERRILAQSGHHIVADGETMQQAGIRWAEVCRDELPPLIPLAYIAALRRMYPAARLF